MKKGSVLTNQIKYLNSVAVTGYAVFFSTLFGIYKKLIKFFRTKDYQTKGVNVTK